MKVEEIQTTEDLLTYILEHEDCIYFLEGVNDERDSIALKNLSSRSKAQRILMLLQEGRIPFVLKHNKELDDHT